MLEFYITYLLEEINKQPFYSEILFIILGFYLFLVFISIILINIINYNKKGFQKDNLLQLERKLLRLKESYESGDISDVEYKKRVQLLKNNITSL